MMNAMMRWVKQSRGFLMGSKETTQVKQEEPALDENLESDSGDDFETDLKLSADSEDEGTEARTEGSAAELVSETSETAQPETEGTSAAQQDLPPETVRRMVGLLREVDQAIASRSDLPRNLKEKFREAGLEVLEPGKDSAVSDNPGVRVNFQAQRFGDVTMKSYENGWVVTTIGDKTINFPPRDPNSLEADQEPFVVEADGTRRPATAEERDQEIATVRGAGFTATQKADGTMRVEFDQPELDGATSMTLLPPNPDGLKWCRHIPGEEGTPGRDILRFDNETTATVFEVSNSDVIYVKQSRTGEIIESERDPHGDSLVERLSGEERSQSLDQLLEEFQRPEKPELTAEAQRKLENTLKSIANGEDRTPTDSEKAAKALFLLGGKDALKRAGFDISNPERGFFGVDISSVFGQGKTDSVTFIARSQSGTEFMFHTFANGKTELVHSSRSDGSSLSTTFSSTGEIAGTREKVVEPGGKRSLDRDGDGNLTEMERSNATKLKIVRDGERATAVHDGQGKSFSRQPDGSWRREDGTTVNGELVLNDDFSYSFVSEKTEHTIHDDGSETFIDKETSFKRESFADGRVIETDGDGNITRTFAANGDETNYKYENGKLARCKAGNVEWELKDGKWKGSNGQEFDGERRVGENGELIARKTGEQSTRAYELDGSTKTRDGQGRITETVSATGDQTRYEYRDGQLQPYKVTYGSNPGNTWMSVNNDNTRWVALDVNGNPGDRFTDQTLTLDEHGNRTETFTGVEANRSYTVFTDGSRLDRNGDGNITRLTTPDKKAYKFDYDSSGSLSQVTRPDGSPSRFDGTWSLDQKTGTYHELFGNGEYRRETQRNGVKFLSDTESGNIIRRETQRGEDSNEYDENNELKSATRKNPDGSEFYHWRDNNGNFHQLVHRDRPDNGGFIRNYISVSGEFQGSVEHTTGVPWEGYALTRDADNKITEIERPNNTKLGIAYEGDTPVQINDGNGKYFRRNLDGSWTREFSGETFRGGFKLNDDHSYSFESDKMKLTINNDGSETYLNKETGLTKQSFSDGRIIESDRDGNVTRTIDRRGVESNYQYVGGELTSCKTGDVEWQKQEDGSWKSSTGKTFIGEKWVGENGALIERKQGETTSKAYELDNSTKTRDGEGRIIETFGATGYRTRYEYRDGETQPYKMTHGSDPGNTWVSVNGDNTRWVRLDSNGKPTDQYNNQTVTLDQDGNRTETFANTGNSYTRFTDGSRIVRNKERDITELETAKGEKYKFTYRQPGWLTGVTRPDGTTAHGSERGWYSSDGTPVGGIGIDQSTGAFYEVPNDLSTRLVVERNGTRIFTDLTSKHLLERTGAFGAVKFTLDDYGEAETEETVEADDSSVTRHRDTSIKELRRPDGYTVQFERDQAGNVTRINESNGASWMRNADGSYTLEGTDETIQGELKIDENGYEFHKANGEIVRRDLAGFSTITADGIERLRINSDGSRIVRDEHGQIDRTMDAAGRWCFYGYEDGKLTTVQEPGGTQWQTEDGTHWLEVKPNGSIGARRQGEYSFEADGTRVFKQSNGVERIEKSDGSSLIRENGDVVEITDKSGRRWHFEYDGNHEPVAMTKPDGSQWEKTAGGWKNSATGEIQNFDVDVDPDGAVTATQEGKDTVTFQTDGWNHITNQSGKDVLSRTNSDGTTVVKNNLGLITEIQSARGTSSFQYDDRGRMASFTAYGITWTLGDEGKWSAQGKTPWEGSVQATENGSMRWKNESFDQTFKSDGSKVNRNTEGQITSVETAGGKKYEYTWDGDNLQSITHPDGSVWTRKYDNTWEIENWDSVEGWQGQIALQDDGTLQKEDSNSKELTTHLTDGGTLVSDQSGKVRRQESADGSRVDYNEAGEVSFRESADGIKETFNPDGTKTKEFPDGTVLVYENDNIVEQRTTDGTVTKYKWEAGLVVECTRGNETLTRIDGTNKWTNSKGGTFEGDIFPTEDGGYANKLSDGIKIYRRDGLVEMQYLDRSVTVRDSAGHITESKDTKGNVRKFERDGDRLLKVTMPDGNTWTRGQGDHWTSSTGKTFDGKIEHTSERGSLVYRYSNGNEDHYKSTGEHVAVKYASALAAYKTIDVACGGSWDGTSRSAIRDQLTGTSDEFRDMIDRIHRSEHNGQGIEQRLRSEDEPDLIGLFIRDNDIKYWDEAEAAADAIESACNHGGFLWTGAGTNEEKINELLRNKPPEYRQLLNDIFRRKYGWQYGDTSYDLHDEFKNEMSDYQLALAESLLDHGEGDVAGRIRVAVLESNNTWFTETRSRNNCEQDVRDTIRSLSKQELDDLRLTYQTRHEISLDEELYGSSSQLSQKTKDALKLYIQAIDGSITKERASMGIGQLACQHEDLELFKEAFAGTPQNWRESFRTKTFYDGRGNSLGNGDDLVKGAFEPSLWNALTLGFSGPVFSGRDLRHAESYVEHGKLSADVLIQDNTSWMGDSEKEIEKTLQSLTDSERDRYFRGKEVGARQNLNESSLSDDDLKALQYYRDVHGALEDAAGKWYSYGSSEAEMLRWEDMIRFKDGGILTQISEHRGDVYDDNLNDVLHTIENMSAQDLDRFRCDPLYQQQVERMLDNYLSDNDTKRAMDILNKMAAAEVDLSTLSPEQQAQVERGQDISRRIAQGEIKESEIETPKDQEDLDFYRKTFLEAAKEAGQRDFLTTLNDNLHWWDDKESNIYNAIQNMTAADRQKYATDSDYRQDIADALDSLDATEKTLALSLLRKVQENPSEKPEIDILEKLQLQDTYWDGDEGKVIREVNKALMVDKSKFSEEELALYARGEELRNASRRPDDSSLSQEERQAIKFFREHNLRDRLLYPITTQEIEYRDTFIEAGRGAIGYGDFDNHVWKLVSGNYSFKDQLSWYNGVVNDSEAGVYEAIEMAGPADWAALIADPAAHMSFLSEAETEVALNIARQKGEFRVEDKLRSYMLGWGTSEAEIHEALQSLDAEGKERVKQAYATKYGTSLTSDLLNEMGGADGIKAMRGIRTEATTARGTWDDARNEYYTSRQGMGSWMVDNTWDGSGYRADEAHFAFAAAMAQEGGLSLEDAQQMSVDLYDAIDSLRDGKLALAELGADAGLALAAVACMFIPGGQAVTAAIAARLGQAATKLPALARLAVQAIARGAQASSGGLQTLMNMSRTGQVATAAMAGGTYRTTLIHTLTGDGADAEAAVQNFLSGAADAGTAFVAPQHIARLAGIGRTAGREAVEGAVRRLGSEGARELLSETGEGILQDGMEALMREAMSTGNYKVARQSLEQLAERAAKEGVGEQGLRVITDALETSLKESMERQSQRALANLVRELSLNAPGGAIGGFAGGVVRINPDLSVQENLNMIGMSTAVGGGAAATFTLGIKGLAAGIPPSVELTKRGYRAIQRLAGSGDAVGDDIADVVDGPASSASSDVIRSAPPQDGDGPAPRGRDGSPQYSDDRPQLDRSVGDPDGVRVDGDVAQRPAGDVTPLRYSPEEVNGLDVASKQWKDLQDSLDNSDLGDGYNQDVQRAMESGAADPSLSAADRAALMKMIDDYRPDNPEGIKRVHDYLQGEHDAAFRPRTGAAPIESLPGNSTPSDDVERLLANMDPDELDSYMDKLGIEDDVREDLRHYLFDDTGELSASWKHDSQFSWRREQLAHLLDQMKTNPEYRDKLTYAFFTNPLRYGAYMSNPELLSKPLDSFVVLARGEAKDSANFEDWTTQFKTAANYFSDRSRDNRHLHLVVIQKGDVSESLWAWANKPATAMDTAKRSHWVDPMAYTSPSGELEKTCPPHLQDELRQTADHYSFDLDGPDAKQTADAVNPPLRDTEVPDGAPRHSDSPEGSHLERPVGDPEGAGVDGANQPRLKPAADVPPDGAYSPTVARPGRAEMDAMALETPSLAKPVADELSERIVRVRDGWAADLTPQAQRVRELQPQVDGARTHLDAQIAQLKAKGATDAHIAAARSDINHPLNKQSKLHELSERWQKVADEHSALTRRINEVTQARRDQLQTEINDFIKQYNLKNPDHPLPEPVKIQLAEHMHAAGGYDFGDGTIVLAKGDLVGAGGASGLSRTTFHEMVHAQQDMDIIRRSIHETTDGGKLPMDIKKVQEHYKNATGKDLSERWLKSVATQNQTAPTMTQPQLARAEQLAAEVKAARPIAEQSVELGNQARVLHAKAQDLRNPQDPEGLNRLMKELSDPNSGPVLAKHLFGDQIPSNVAKMMKDWAALPKDANGLALDFKTPAGARSNLSAQFDAHRDAVNAQHKRLVDDYAGTRLEREAYGFDGNVREPHELPPSPRPTGAAATAAPQSETPVRYSPEEVNALDAASKQWKDLQDSLHINDLGDGFNQDVKRAMEMSAEDPNLSAADKATLKKLIDDYRPDNPEGIKRVHDYLKGEHDAAFRPRGSVDVQETLPNPTPSVGKRLVANMDRAEVDSYLKDLAIDEELSDELLTFLFDDNLVPDWKFGRQFKWRREQLSDLLDRLKTTPSKDDIGTLVYTFTSNPLKYGAYMQHPELISRPKDFVVIARGEEKSSGNVTHWTDQFRTAANYFLDKRHDNRHLHLVVIDKENVSEDMWRWASMLGKPIDTTGIKPKDRHWVDQAAFNSPSGETEKLLQDRRLQNELKRKGYHHFIDPL